MRGGGQREGRVWQLLQCDAHVHIWEKLSGSNKHGGRKTATRSPQVLLLLSQLLLPGPTLLVARVMQCSAPPLPPSSPSPPPLSPG